MKCIACGQQFSDDSTLPLVCQNCGTLNTPTVDNASETTAPVDNAVVAPKKSFLGLKSITSKQIAFIAGLLVMAILGGWLLLNRYHNYQSAPTLSSQPPDELPIPTVPKNWPSPTPTPSVSPTPKVPTPTPSTILDNRKTSTAAIGDLMAATSVAQAEEALRAFLSQYDVTLQMLSFVPSSYAQTYATYTTLDDSDLEKVKEYGRIFIDEWAKYPTDWISNAGLRAIAIVDELFVSGTYRAAMPDPVGDAVYYDPSYTGDYAREVVHHEFNHLITYNYFGNWSPADPVWVSYNPPGFTYGDGGASCYEPDNDCLTGVHPIDGFVSGYAASGIEEDKAELYACLMASVCYGQLQGWIETDTYLAQKVTNYKQFISSHSPEMSGTYFDDINL